MDVPVVPHNPTTDVAVLRYSTGSSDRSPLGPDPAILTDAARCTFDKAVLLRRIERRELLRKPVGLDRCRIVPTAED